MHFDELDRRLRVFETAHDHCALPGLYLVARLDGRGFTHLTRERHPFAAPFDERFRDLMTATVRHLMDRGFRIVYGYTQSDEISLLFHPDEDAFGRKLRKWLSILAGEASACFTLNLGEVACFDCRVSQLPRLEWVVDCFTGGARTRAATPSTAIVIDCCAGPARRLGRPRGRCWGCRSRRKTNCCSSTASTSTSDRRGRSAALAGIGRLSPNRALIPAAGQRPQRSGGA